MRGVARFLASVVALVSGMCVLIALVALLADAAGFDAGEEECCRRATEERAAAVVVGKVEGQERDVVVLDVEEVERGRLREPVARTFGVHLSPWRRYRMYLFLADNGSHRITDHVPPESLGLTVPSGLGAMSALPLSTRFGIAATPALLASLWVLLRTREPAY